MIIVKKIGEKAQTHTAEYILDTPTDVKNLPTDVEMGSLAFVISNSSVYMLNSSGEWKEI